MALLAPLACNLLPGGPAGAPTPEATGPEGASAGLTAPPQPTETPPLPPDFYDLEGNPVYAEPLPREAVDLMLGQVQAGDLSLEEGVLGLLRLLAGEAPLPEYTQEGEGELELKSGWGLSMLAYEVHQNSDDEELKAELERLMRILAPPQEALDRYAAPASSSRRPRSGLGRSQTLQISCDEIWHQGFPESAGPVPTCLLYDWFVAGGHEFRVYYPTDLQNDSVAMERVHAALDALRDSQEKYSELVEVRSINLVFSLVSAVAVGGPEKGVAMVPAFGPGELGALPCPVTVFNAAKNVPVPNFKQIIAHEVFHCIHLWRKGVSGYVDMKWYNEGMAEYFSNVVYPQVNHEHMFVAEFHADSITDSIFEMTYQNTVLFQYLGNRFGDPWLIDLLDGMPYEQGAIVNYMAALPDIERVFHDFAEAYMESRIEDTGGGLLPGSPLFWPGKSVHFPDAGPLELEAKPFQIERARLEFEENRLYQLDLDLEGDPASESSKLPPGGWASLPSPVSACGAPAVYVEVLTTTEAGSPSSTAATFDISLTQSEESGCDPCLVGEWERGIPAATDYWDAVRAAMSSMQSQLASVGGIHRLIFYGDGVYESRLEDYSLDLRGPSVAGPFGVQSTDAITTVQRSALGAYVTIDLTQLLMVEQFFHMQTQLDVIASGPISSQHSEQTSESGKSPLTELPEARAYTCTPTTLSYEAEVPLAFGNGPPWVGELVFTRVSSTPPTPSVNP